MQILCNKDYQQKYLSFFVLSVSVQSLITNEYIQYIHKSKLMLFCLVDLYFITVFQITNNNSFFTVTQNYIK